MGRIGRVVMPGVAHHVIQRGNRRMRTFFGDDDYRAYLALLTEWSRKHEVRVWAYCLMPNHVHVVLVPPTAEALCRCVGEAHRRYTRRVNFREGWRGHLWQGRFASYPMDEAYTVAATAYIERNPVKAGLVARAEDWPWSSAAGHVRRTGDAVAEGAWLTDQTAGWVCSWAEHLAGPAEPDLGERLRRHENTGRPLGGETFVRKLERALGRRLTPGRPGRPRKITAPLRNGGK